MKKIFSLTILLLLITSAYAITDDVSPCCMCGKYTDINLPINNIEATNAISGNKKFIGNGNIPSSVNFSSFTQLVFQGTQHVNAYIRLQTDQHLYLHGSIELDQVQSTENSTIWVNQNSTVSINKLALANAPKFYVWDETGTYLIEGKVYKAGDTIQRDGRTITIQKCNTGLPVTYENLSVNDNGKGFTLSFTTSHESNNKFFDVEVSRDGKSFEVIETIVTKAKNGNSDLPLSYTFSTTAVVVVSFLPLALIGFAFKKRFLAVAIVCLVLFACDKRGTIATSGLKEANYVRIKQVDINGNYSYSKTLKIPNK